MEPPLALFPRWRGFNLPELASGQRGAHFLESDFSWMAEWGFNFARLPLSYWIWSSPDNWLHIDEGALLPVDQAIEWGRAYGIHINISFHRIPGYCVNGREAEPFQLFDSPRDSMEQALDAAMLHWEFFARRYAGIPNQHLSFDLINEPPWMPNGMERYVEIARHLVGSIRSISPQRLIFADGADIGQTPVEALIPLNLVQSTRGYLPKMISHYTAGWVPENEFESKAFPAQWPMSDDFGLRWDKERLREKLIQPWQPIESAGCSVHVGEWGCHNRTPHAVALAWMEDLLELWKTQEWGWALWNLRGSFGVVDSERKDVTYEEFNGHLLDRKMLELLKAH